MEDTFQAKFGSISTKETEAESKVCHTSIHVWIKKCRRVGGKIHFLVKSHEIVRARAENGH